MAALPMIVPAPAAAAAHGVARAHAALREKRISARHRRGRDRLGRARRWSRDGGPLERRGAGARAAAARVPQGDDELHLTCETCPDGTTVSVGGARATFAKTLADLKLASPLHTGDNPLDLSLDRPGVGRDEVVHAVVPVSFRIKTDITTLAQDAPAITVRVEAAPGSQVTVDGTNVVLDAQGKGAHVVDVTSDLMGPADEGKQLEKKIPYVVTMKDAASKLSTEQGTVTASIPIPPLRVDSPTAHAVIDKDSFFSLEERSPKAQSSPQMERRFRSATTDFSATRLLPHRTATRI